MWLLFQSYDPQLLDKLWRPLWNCLKGSLLAPGTCVNFLVITEGCCFLHLPQAKGCGESSHSCLRWLGATGCCHSPSFQLLILLSGEDVAAAVHGRDVSLQLLVVSRAVLGQAEHSYEPGQCPFSRVKPFPSEINGITAIAGPGFLPEAPHWDLR